MQKPSNSTIQRVSLYIPTFNSERYIKDCLDAILEQTYPIDETIVVDGGSKDRTVEIAARYPVRVISQLNRPGAGGLGLGRNVAVENCRNEFVASIDADVAATPTWLEKLMGVLEQDNSLVGACGRMVEKFQSDLADRWRSIHMVQDFGDEAICDPRFLYGCGTVFRKSALEAVGLYCDRPVPSEDVEICVRLYARGYHLYYTPEAIAYHLRRDTVKSLLRNYWWWSYWWWSEGPGRLKRFQTFANLLYKILRVDVYSNLRDLALQDVRSLRLGLVILDGLLIPYSVYLDINYYLRNLHKPTKPA